MVFVLAGTVTDGALPGSHHFHCFTGPTVALFSSTTLTVSSCFVHFDDTLGGTENIGCNTVSNPNGQTEKLCPWVDYCSLFRCTNESDCLCQFTWPDRAATPPFSITPISGATDFYDQESVSQEKTLTTNNSVIHTMPPNTQGMGLMCMGPLFAMLLLKKTTTTNLPAKGILTKRTSGAKGEMI